MSSKNKNNVSNGVAVSANCSPNDVVYVLKSYSIQDLEGKILTFIDASIQDPIQRKALKDLLRPMVWTWAIESNMSSYYEVKEVSVCSGRVN